MSTANLDGYTVTDAVTHFPAYGVPFVEVTIDSPTVLSGAVTLTIADLVLECTVVSGGPWKGSARYRLVVGGGGWGKTIAAKHWASDTGVKRSTVLHDAADACGERLGPFADAVLGPSWTRAAGEASATLHSIAPQGWYVDNAGVTQIGARPVVQYAGDATVQRVDPAQVHLDLATESIAALLPGVVVDGMQAVDVTHELSADKLRVTLWGKSAGVERALDTRRKINALLDPSARYRGVYEYRVVTQEGERLNLQPVRVSLGMPDLRRVRVCPGVPGVRADHALGSLVHVVFLNADPAQPRVIAFDDAETSGFRPDELLLCAGASGAYPTEHAASIEAVVNLLNQVLLLLGAAVTPTILPPAVTTLLQTAIAAAGTPFVGTIADYTSAIEAALAIKIPNVTGAFPSVGWPAVRGG